LDELCLSGVLMAAAVAPHAAAYLGVWGVGVLVVSEQSGARSGFPRSDEQYEAAAWPDSTPTSCPVFGSTIFKRRDAVTARPVFGSMIWNRREIGSGA